MKKRCFTIIFLVVFQIAISAIVLLFLDFCVGNLNLLTFLLYIFLPSIIGTITYAMVNKKYFIVRSSMQNVIVSLLLAAICIVFYTVAVNRINGNETYLNAIIENTLRIIPSQFIVESDSSSLSNFAFPAISSFLIFFFGGFITIRRKNIQNTYSTTQST